MDVRELLAHPPNLHQISPGVLTTWKIGDDVLKYIAETVGPGCRTLETGAGISTVVFALRGSDHICIAPADDEIDRIKGYCAQKQISLQKVQFLIERSEKALPRLALSDLDLVLIDGSHSFPNTFIDWFYTADALRPGGTLVLDNTDLYTGKLLRDFLKSEPEWRHKADLGVASVFIRGEGTASKGWWQQPYVVRRSEVTDLVTYYDIDFPGIDESKLLLHLVVRGRYGVALKWIRKRLARLASERFASRNGGTPLGAQSTAANRRLTGYPNQTELKALMSQNAVYDQQLDDVMKRALRPTSVCIDVGAFQGTMLQKMFEACPLARHFAFEPIPSFAASLRQNYPLARVFQVALSDHTGADEFVHVANDPAYSGLRRRIYDRPDPKIEKLTVKVGRLDDFVPDNTDISLIKIDVEGGEYGVMRGAAETIRRCRPFIVFEAGPRSTSCYGVQPEDIHRFLHECGLSVSTMGRWMANRGPLERDDFCRSFREQEDFYFLAYPASDSRPSTISSEVDSISRFGLDFRADTTDPWIIEEVIERNCYLRDFVTRHVEPGQLVVDVGAHIGTFAYISAKELQPSAYLCLEPEPSNFEYLERNLHSLGLADVAKALQVAASDHNGTSLLHVSAGNAGGHSLVPEEPGLGGLLGDGLTTQEVVTRTLDSLLEELDLGNKGIGVLKVDAEGSELAVLRGATAALRRTTAVVGELHGTMVSREQLTEALSDFAVAFGDTWSTQQLTTFWAINRRLLDETAEGEFRRAAAQAAAEEREVHLVERVRELENAVSIYEGALREMREALEGPARRAGYVAPTMPSWLEKLTPEGSLLRHVAEAGLRAYDLYRYHGLVGLLLHLAQPWVWLPKLIKDAPVEPPEAYSSSLAARIWTLAQGARHVWRSEGALVFMSRILAVREWLPVLLRAKDTNVPIARGGALVIDWKIPVYDRNAGALRLFHIIRIFREFGIPVTVLPHDLEPLQPYTDELRAMGVQVIHGAVDVLRYLRHQASGFDFCFINYADLAQSYIPYLREVAPNLKIIYDTVDLHFLREQRRAAFDGSSDRAESYRELEVGLASMSEAVVTVTERERALLQEELPNVPIHVVPTIHVPRPSSAPFESRAGLLFVGSFPHSANGDAAVYFVENILPLVRQELGAIPFYIVGNEPKQDVKALASEDVMVTGWVRDLEPYYERSRLFVAPLRWGAGIKGKIGESMARGLPVVTTSVGAEGMGLEDGRQVQIADDPTEFAAKIVEAYTKRDLWERLSAGSLAHVSRHYSPEIVREQVRTLLESHGLLPESSAP